MHKSTLLVAAVVYKISLNGFAMFQCQDPKLFSPVLNACVSEVKDQRVQKDFDSKKSAEDWARMLKGNKNPAYTISDIHVLSEDGVK